MLRSAHFRFQDDLLAENALRYFISWKLPILGVRLIQPEERCHPNPGAARFLVFAKLEPSFVESHDRLSNSRNFGACVPDCEFEFDCSTIERENSGNNLWGFHYGVIRSHPSGKSQHFVCPINFQVSGCSFACWLPNFDPEMRSPDQP